MAITDIPELSDFGAPKASAFPTVDATKQIRADDFNEVCQRVIDVTSAVGLDDGSTSGSLRRSAALSVKGNATNATAAVADITAASDGQVLRRSGTSIGFGEIATAGIADGAVTDAKLSSALQTTIGALVDVADPLSVFPSYGLTRGLWTGAGCTDYLGFAGSPCGPFSRSVSGTGAGSSIANPDSGSSGVEAFSTGTTATGFSLSATSGNALLITAGVIRWRGRFRVPTESDGTETFAVQAGLTQNVSSLAPDRACVFRYRHSVNGGLLECVNRSSGSESGSVFNTSINPVMASGFLDLEIELDSTSGVVTYVSSGTTVTTITTNIPTASIGAGVSIIKSAGTTARTFEIDAQGVWQGGLAR